MPLSDMLFAATFKVYSGFSSRRFTSDVRTAMDDGLIDRAPHFNTVSNYLADPNLTPLLRSLIELSASPLKAVEVDFAVDSTGFSTSTYRRWFDAKWGKARVKALWIKAHLMVGVTTNVVTAAEVTPHESADSPQLPDLLDTTAETFENIREVSGDKAYNSKRNLSAIAGVGATPYIPFKSYSTTPGKDSGSIWNRMWHLYNFHQSEFAAHYHKRSNAETTMMMIKSKFGGSVKSKTPDAQVNEVLCKVLAHNICVLIQSHYELGIESTFCADRPAAQKVPYLRLL